MSKLLELSTPPAAAVVLLSGDESSLALARHVKDAVMSGVDHLVVDAGDSTLLSSHVLETLQRAARRLRARGGRVIIVCPNPALARLLRLVFLNHSSEVVGSLDEAQPEWS